MDYDVLQEILKPDRILDIWETEEADRKRRIPLIRATQINDLVETILENPNYTIKDKSLKFQEL